MSIRKETADRFRTEWADVPALAGFKVIATERAIDIPKVPTALIRQKSIGRAASAPNSMLDVGLLLTLIAPGDNLDTAAELLDDAVPAAIEYLRPRYLAERAEAVGWTGSRLAYDIPFNVIAPKE